MPWPTFALLQCRHPILSPLIETLYGLFASAFLVVLTLGFLYARFFDALSSKRDEFNEASSSHVSEAQASAGVKVASIDASICDDGAQTPVQAILNGIGPTPATPLAFHPDSRTVPARSTSAPPSPSIFIPRNLDAVLLAVANTPGNGESCCTISNTISSDGGADIESRHPAPAVSQGAHDATESQPSIPALPVSTPVPMSQLLDLKHRHGQDGIEGSPQETVEDTATALTVPRNAPPISAVVAVPALLFTPKIKPTQEGNNTFVKAANVRSVGENTDISQPRRLGLSVAAVDSDWVENHDMAENVAAASHGFDGFNDAVSGAAPVPCQLLIHEQSCVAVPVSGQLASRFSFPEVFGVATGEASGDTPSAERLRGIEDEEVDSLSSSEDALAVAVHSDAVDQAAGDTSAGAATGAAVEGEEQLATSTRAEGALLVSPSMGNALAPQSMCAASKAALAAASGTPLKASSTPATKRQLQSRRSGGSAAAAFGKETASTAPTPRIVAVSPKQKRAVVSPTGVAATATPATARRPVGLETPAARSPKPTAGDKRPVARRLNPGSPKTGLSSPPGAAFGDGSMSSGAQTAPHGVHIEASCAAGTVPRYAAPTAASMARKVQAAGTTAAAAVTLQKLPRLGASQKLPGGASSVILLESSGGEHAVDGAVCTSIGGSRDNVLVKY